MERKIHCQGIRSALYLHSKLLSLQFDETNRSCVSKLRIDLTPVALYDSMSREGVICQFSG